MLIMKAFIVLHTVGMKSAKKPIASTSCARHVLQ